MTKLFIIFLFFHLTHDCRNLHIHLNILTNNLESVLDIVPEQLERPHLSALACLQFVNTAHFTIYCYCAAPASKVHELWRELPITADLSWREGKPELAADEQSSSQGSCHILEVPEMKQQLIFTVRFCSRSFRPKDYLKWRWLYNDLGEWPQISVSFTVALGSVNFILRYTFPNQPTQKSFWALLQSVLYLTLFPYMKSGTHNLKNRAEVTGPGDWRV